MHQPGEDYQTLFGMLNRSPMVWECAAHPDVQKVVSHFLGEGGYRVVDCCSKPSWPGSPAQVLHADSASGMAVVLPPECPWLINGIWMLTDFTIENGCTRVVPMSHTSRLRTPPFQESPLIRPVRPLHCLPLTFHGLFNAFQHLPSTAQVEGKAGDLLLWHGGLFHQAGPNTSADQVRVGLNLGYNPTWSANDDASRLPHCGLNYPSARPPALSHPTT